MPIIKSAKKRVRQAEVRRSRNIKVKNAVRQETKALIAAIESEKDAKTIQTALSEAFSQIDRAAKKGVLKPNTAARRKSSLAKLADSKSPKPAAKPKAKKTPAKPAAKKKTT